MAMEEFCGVFAGVEQNGNTALELPALFFLDYLALFRFWFEEV